MRLFLALTQMRRSPSAPPIARKGLLPSKRPGNSPSEVPNDAPDKTLPTARKNTPHRPRETRPATLDLRPRGRPLTKFPAIGPRALAPKTITNAPIVAGP